MHNAHADETLGDMISLHFAAWCRMQQSGEDRRLKRRTSEEAAVDAADAQSADWLQETLKDSLKTFGGHVQKRFEGLERRM